MFIVIRKYRNLLITNADKQSAEKDVREVIAFCTSFLVITK